MPGGVRVGRLGLGSTRGVAHGAWWASWVDALEMVHRVAESIKTRLNHVAQHSGCVEELQAAAATLARQAFLGRTQWDDLRIGVRPLLDHPQELGEWAHGWQEPVVMTNSSASNQAHWKSHADFDYGSSDVFCNKPVHP